MRSGLLRERLNKKKGFFLLSDRIFLMKSVLVIKTFLIFARELYISY